MAQMTQPVHYPDGIPFHHRISCTIPDACKGTGLSRTKLYALMDAGVVESTKMGKRRLVIIRTLLAAIDPSAPKEPKAPKAA